MSKQILAQAVAVERSVKARVKRELTDLYHLLEKPDFFAGFNRKYFPVAEGGETFPPETKKVQQSVSDVLKKCAALFTELLDVSATRDFANSNAKADLIVDGVCFVKDVPAPYLLFLEKTLAEIHAVVASAPTLDPAEEWIPDTNSSLSKTAPRMTAKTKKVMKALMKAPATKEHPAQTEAYSEDERVGNWELVTTSSAIPIPVKEKLLARIQKLQRAVKLTREEANRVEAPDVTVGEKILGWVMQDLT